MHSCQYRGGGSVLPSLVMAYFKTVASKRYLQREGEKRRVLEVYEYWSPCESGGHYYRASSTTLYAHLIAAAPAGRLHAGTAPAAVQSGCLLASSAAASMHRHQKHAMLGSLPTCQPAGCQPSRSATDRVVFTVPHKKNTPKFFCHIFYNT